MTAYDHALIERLVAEARADDYAMTPGPWETGDADNAATLRARPCIRGGTPEAPVDVIITFGRAYSDARGIARTRNNLTAVADQLEAAKREVGRLELLVKVHPDDIKSIVAENDRMHAAFDQALTALRTPGMKISSAFCTWCGQHWPKLDGETYEEARRHTMEHAESCPANDIRIERDALRAELERLTVVDAAGPMRDGHEGCAARASGVNSIEPSTPTAPPRTPMPDAKPMAPERLAEIERILCSNATWWREYAVDLVAEVRRLIAVAVDIETQRSTIARQAIEQELKLETRIVRLEAGLREALGRWEYPNPTHADKAREDELWQLLQANNTKETA